MTYTSRIKPARFRLWCTQQYYANRDEYDAVGETQPHSFSEYVSANITLLREGFRLNKKVDRPRC